MKPLPRSASIALFAMLAAVMLATRFHHFGTALNLPDASMAVFFLGGLYLRRHVPFAVFVGLAIAIDWIAIAWAGVSDFCVTPAYAFLPLAYATLWYGGRACALHLRETPISLGMTLVVALLCASLSFAISNGAFYWLGGRYATPNVAEYFTRLWQWGPLFVRTTLCYITVGMVAHVLVVRLMRSGVALPSNISQS
jgi:hypothetical protein